MNKPGRAVLCIETGKVFVSVTAAAKHYGVSYKRIETLASGEANTKPNEHSFMYLEKAGRGLNKSEQKVKDRNDELTRILQEGR